MHPGGLDHDFLWHLIMISQGNYFAHLLLLTLADSTPVGCATCPTKQINKVIEYLYCSID
jgi:hypothetical protein